ncbi:inosose dehydratase [Kaistia soli DSM 19436]|uniref:Inosose dehydratase n=1 Tax=Kaistia soli DSM 19436 TaxID=1122133 RepID=A0A1M5C3U1_9HYPH|nr:sugar phosphate isomerase/epimerase [Kaistia soli]SHF49316.1 inosose dehydratase [Kaistia soli DSM 19436]
MTTLFATDMITFYQPAFWGLDTTDELNAFASSKPDAFWDKVMAALSEAGVSGIELTFGPGSIDNVLKAFGSAKAFGSTLEARGLTVVSAFMADAPAWSENADLPAIIADAERRAAFLAEAGGEILVTGLPMRRTVGVRPPLFIDVAFMSHAAGIAHAIGEAVAAEGIKLAVHTESNSALWYERDIDLFMAFTDPRYVGLCPDSCHITLGGGDPVRTARRYNQRIILAHWKDAVGEITENLVIDDTIFTQQQRFMVDFGAGVVDWNGWSEAMLATPGCETVLLELDAAPDPVAALRAGRAVVERARS